jgi:hypothetical protein
VTLHAKNIAEVIHLLEAVVDQTIQESDAHGIFAATYLQMTRRVSLGIDAGLFDDGERMDRFDTLFANRYLTALSQRRSGRAACQSWQVVFEGAEEADNIALQHMLLGVNAHISFDLPVAAADTAPGSIEDLQDDFERINTIISVLLDEAQEVLNENSSGMDMIDRMGGDVDEWLAVISLQKMRARAWSEAQALASFSPECRKKAEQTSDRETASLGRLITRPPRILQATIDLIRLGEHGKTAAIITGLAAIEADISDLKC